MMINSKSKDVEMITTPILSVLIPRYILLVVKTIIELVRRACLSFEFRKGLIVVFIFMLLSLSLPFNHCSVDPGEENMGSHEALSLVLEDVMSLVSFGWITIVVVVDSDNEQLEAIFQNCFSQYAPRNRRESVNASARLGSCLIAALNSAPMGLLFV